MSAIDTLIRGRERDLGGFTVHRVLPAGPRQMVGPFIFFDAMGPATFAPGTGRWVSVSVTTKVTSVPSVLLVTKSA